ncbi:MAG: hypothetical protein RJA57_1613 [Bacteroidota bacterium]|jgi:KDO2-lipid IV(A) lauroyltransferase
MYHIVRFFLYLISLLPIRILYLISDGIYLLVFYVFKYRRAVTMANLLIAFPDKTEAERKRIAKRYYRNLIDTFVEIIKMMTASRRFLEKRFQGNWDLVNRHAGGGNRIQIHLGHNFNWEWGNVVAGYRFASTLLAVYMPPTSKVFARLMHSIRARGGTIMLDATKMAEEFAPYRDRQYILGLVADQNPGHPDNAWWVRFFGRPTPFVKGPARAAVSNNLTTFFAFIHKPRRGHYEVVFTLAAEHAGQTSETELTIQFVRYLEDVIRTYPDMWLWSHRRWKWVWSAERGSVIG